MACGLTAARPRWQCLILQRWPADDLAQGKAKEVGDRRVGGDGKRQEEPLRLAVFGEQGNALFDGLMRGGQVRRAVGIVQEYLSGMQRIGTEDRPQGLGSARPNQSGKAEDLAMVQIEGDIANGGARPRFRTRSATAPVVSGRA